MKQAALLLTIIAAAFMLGYAVFGFVAMYRIAYGAISMMALMISFTFFWLWNVRATPLALGMTFSWAGIGLITGWWWLSSLLGAPSWMEGNAIFLLFLALHVSGSVLHFAVIQRSFDFEGARFLFPVMGAFMAAIAVHMLI